ncbi:MAG: hypothetical protein U1F77_13700 [Kiritimatiellia bacterium]
MNIGATSRTTKLTLTGASAFPRDQQWRQGDRANFGIGGRRDEFHVIDLSGLGTFNANLGTGTLGVGLGSTNTEQCRSQHPPAGRQQHHQRHQGQRGRRLHQYDRRPRCAMRLGSGANAINTADLYIQGVYGNQGRQFRNHPQLQHHHGHPDPARAGGRKHPGERAHR